MDFSVLKMACAMALRATCLDVLAGCRAFRVRANRCKRMMSVHIYRGAMASNFFSNCETRSVSRANCTSTFMSTGAGKTGNETPLRGSRPDAQHSPHEASLKISLAPLQVGHLWPLKMPVELHCRHGSSYLVLPTPSQS
jgi:hypothetical protein